MSLRDKSKSLYIFFTAGSLFFGACQVNAAAPTELYFTGTLDGLKESLKVTGCTALNEKNGEIEADFKADHTMQIRYYHLDEDEVFDFELDSTLDGTWTFNETKQTIFFALDGDVSAGASGPGTWGQKILEPTALPSAIGLACAKKNNGVPTNSRVLEQSVRMLTGTVKIGTDGVAASLSLRVDGFQESPIVATATTVDGAFSYVATTKGAVNVNQSTQREHVAPTLVSSSYIGGVVSFTFSEPMDPDNYSFGWNADTLVLGTAFVNGAWSVDHLVYHFNANVPSGTTISFQLNPTGAPSGDSGFRDAQDNVLAADTTTPDFLVP